jgi:hypothetical protein
MGENGPYTWMDFGFVFLGRMNGRIEEERFLMVYQFARNSDKTWRSFRMI